MPDSDLVFEQGEAIDVGSHGDDDLLYHDGDPVPNTGASSLVFEAGTGLGGDGGITIPQLVTLPALSCALDASGDATITALVFLLRAGKEPGLVTYIDALYFTVTTLTTTGFGDITMESGTGRVLAVGEVLIHSDGMHEPVARASLTYSIPPK